MRKVALFELTGRDVHDEYNTQILECRSEFTEVSEDDYQIYKEMCNQCKYISYGSTRYILVEQLDLPSIDSFNDEAKRIALIAKKEIEQENDRREKLKKEHKELEDKKQRMIEEKERKKLEELKAKYETKNSIK